MHSSKIISKILFLQRFILYHVYECLAYCVSCACSTHGQEGVSLPETGITDGFELLCGARNQTQVIC